MTNKVYARQKLALAPFTENFSETALVEKITDMENQEKNDFLKFLMANNLGPAWPARLSRKTIKTLCPGDQSRKLHEESRRIAFIYLQQKAAIQTISYTLEKNSIPYAVFKGAHTRELAYPNPATRPSVDIDILIEEKGKKQVIQLLMTQGYLLHTKTKNLTHEASLIKGSASIDLHWHILRPGRIPKALTSELLGDRTKYASHWSFSNEHNLFILLIHPVFAKYSTTTQCGLIRMLDLPTRLQRWPFCVKTAFTLFAHDDIGHAIRFLRILFSDKLWQKQNSEAPIPTTQYRSAIQQAS